MSMNQLSQMLGGALSPELLEKLLLTAGILAGLWVVRLLLSYLIGRRCEDLSRCYFWRRRLSFGYAILALTAVVPIWFSGLKSLATFFGLFSAGLAIAMHDVIANVAGWVFILSRKPFKVGDRIQVGTASGDVIDIRVFQFSMVEIGNWVAADHSTGRIIHVPNSRVLREPLANYETGFEYIWHEVPVLITFESNWTKAKEILTRIVNEKTTHLSEGAQEQIRRAAMKYLIYFRHLTPIVYTTVRDSGVLLTLRYITKPRLRRSSEQDVWEAILTAFAQHEDISLAYPTTRFYRGPEQAAAGQR